MNERARRVLIATNSEEIFQISCRAAVDNGCDYELAPNHCCDDIANSAEFDCIILDDGALEGKAAQVLDNISRRNSCRFIPVIVISSSNSSEYLISLCKSGMTDFVARPLIYDNLRVRLFMALANFGDAISELDQFDEESLKLMCPIDSKPLMRNRFHFVRPSDCSTKADLMDYFNSLSQIAASQIQLIAINIRLRNPVPPQTSSREMRYVWDEVSRSLKKAFGPHIELLTFLSSGLFLCTSRSAAEIDNLRIESDILAELHDRHLYWDDGKVIDVDVAVGSPAMLNSAGYPSIDDVIARAIARAKVRGAQRVPEKPRPIFR